jgi:MFS family permease
MSLVPLVMVAMNAVYALSAWPFGKLSDAMGHDTLLAGGLLAAMVADTAPVDLRGTAFGQFNLVSGLAMLLASVIAGLLWEGLGAQATFVAGGVFAALALPGLAIRQRAVSAAGTWGCASRPVPPPPRRRPARAPRRSCPD